MVGEAQANGQTVFMSSHVLSEVQQRADRVGIVRDGSLVALESVDDLRRRAARRVEVALRRAGRARRRSRGSRTSPTCSVEGSVLRCRVTGRADALVKALASHPVATLTVEQPDLEDLFFAYYGAEADHAA